MHNLAKFGFLVVGISFVCSSGDVNDGGWMKTTNSSWLTVNNICNIPIEDGSLTNEDFLEKYAYNYPVIIRNVPSNKMFRELCSRSHISSNYGDVVIRLSSSNSYSYEKHDMSLKAYLDTMTSTLQPSTLANETFYFFGDMLTDELNEILQHYKIPPYTLPNTSPMVSFGIAGAGTGVPFHFHGPGFAEVIYGRKHWFLYPPSVMPAFNPNETTLHWYQNNYPKLDDELKPLECTIEPDEVIYFPDHWWHATLNLDTSIFLSTFLG